MDDQESKVDRLLKMRAELDEELRRHKSAFTVLFTDVVGSTEYFDRFGDTAGLAMLHRHTDQAATTVSELSGRVIKTIGDSVMAECPEPIMAVRAAIELQNRLLLLNRTLPQREQLQLRIGIHTGVGFPHGSDVYGDAVNESARVTKHTGTAQILISSAVRDSQKTGAANKMDEVMDTVGRYAQAANFPPQREAVLFV